MKNEDLTILINTFQSDEKIYSCLDSINNDIKVLVIENSNNLSFKEKIEKKYKNVSCHLSSKNLGYAKGNNLGLSMIKSKFALILNPDALLSKNAIENFFYSASKLDQFAIIAPAIQDEKKIKRNELKKFKNLIEVENVKGFAMFLNLDQFKEIGYFDDNFFIYFEEIDLCRRLRKLGKKIYLDSSIFIEHIGGSSHNQSINFQMELSRNWHWMWSTFYYRKKHQGFIVALLLVLPKLTSSMFKFLLFSLIKNEKRKKIYSQRFSGLLNSIKGKESWYRPKV